MLGMALLPRGRMNGQVDSKLDGAEIVRASLDGHRRRRSSALSIQARNRMLTLHREVMGSRYIRCGAGEGLL